MRGFWRATALALPLLAGGAVAQTHVRPHQWLYGSWTGGRFAASDTTSAACYALPTIIFTSDAVLRAGHINLVTRTGLADVGHRQRVIESVDRTARGVQFRLVPGVSSGTASSQPLPPDTGFGCAGGPDMLNVERRGPNEISFPGCTGFPFPLRRCGAPLAAGPPGERRPARDR